MSTSVSLWLNSYNLYASSWSGLAFGNDTYVAVSSSTSGTDGIIAYSANPVNGTWTTVTTSASGANGWFRVAFGNNFFVTVTNTSGNNQSAISSNNGSSWTIKPLIYDAPTDQWFGVEFGNNVFIAITKKGIVNTWDCNLSNPWVKQTTNQPSTVPSYAFVKFVNGKFVMISNSVGLSTVYTSTDGQSWTTKTTSMFNGTWTSIAYGNEVYVAISSSKNLGKQVAVSSDLINWTMYYIGNQTSPTSGSLYRLFSVVFANNQFLMLDNRFCFTSTNGTTWTSFDYTSDTVMNVTRTGLVYANNGYVSMSNATTASATPCITATTVAPTLSNFTVPSQTSQSPPFTLTAPTSNSSGAFTYTSSNLSVATISGSTVTIVGAGSSTITALQAATTSFTAGSIQSTLYVSAKTDPTLSNFSIPNTAYGTAPFTITPPTSNSSGAFSYASSNESVATIVSVNKLNIVGAGTSTITATQAETAEYFAGSIDTPFQATANSIENPALVTDGDMLTYFMDTSATCAEIMNSIVVNEPVLLNTDTISTKLLTMNGSGSGNLVTISYEVP